ncbi:MAG: hypothetical protein RR330_01655 [Alistipes sp.]
MKTKTTSISNFMERDVIYDSPNLQLITICAERGFVGSLDSKDNETMTEEDQNPW